MRSEPPRATPPTARPRDEHFVAPPLDETPPLQEVDALDTTQAPPRSMYAEAAHSLIRNPPVFIVSGLLILAVLFVAAFPGLFTDQDPSYGSMDQANQPPSSEHPFGTTRQATTCSPAPSTGPAPR